MEPQNTISKLFTYVSLCSRTHFLLSLIIMISLSPSSTASKLGNKTDLLALFELKLLITDDPNNILSSWNESRHHCRWPGVTCGHKHHRVTGLDLHEQNLFGRISPHIGNLSFLKNIDFSNNRVNGEIPQEIGKLYRLKRLDMINNTLGGSIPFNLSYCADLNLLYLGGNKLMGEIPVGLGSLKKIQDLWLFDNYLSGEIPQSLGNLSSLESFSLQFNNLRGSIPNEFTHLRNLTFFSISANNVSDIFPTSMYNISSLDVISIGGNRLTGSLPLDFGSALPNLKELYIGKNLFTGIIPASFANASLLQRIDISANRFIGQVPNTIGLLSDLLFLNMELNQLGGNSTQDLSFLLPLSNCTNLNILDFGYNSLTGQLPNSIANLSIHLKTLYMGGNQIYGPIPEAVMSLTGLYSLGIETNYLSGVLPSSFGKLQQLQQLYLKENRISGQIPSSFGNLSQIGELDISVNNIFGQIPQSIGNCQKLQVLQMSNNNLSSIIPPQVIGIPSLSLVLDLSKNSLTGQLPVEVGKLTNLNLLDISGNNLSGEIPLSIGDCSSLEYLNIRGNSFQGVIPSNLANLKGIEYLDLSLNNLSGQIPTELDSLTYLQYLNLSFNDLEGEIPRKGVFTNTSAISLVGNTKLCGGIPELDQPPCPDTQEKKRNEIKLVAFVVCGMVLLIAVTSFSVIYWRRKTRKASNAASFEEDKLMKVSYWELYKATNGFSSENAIGFGSFGSVYKGKLNRQMDIVIAVKVLNLENDRASKSFVAECEILKNVRHRNLVKILTYCSSIDSRRNEFKALVYEFMPNGNLDMWLHLDETNSSRTLSLLQRVDIAIDVACALQYLHSYCETPIVHCDLKPSNILLDDDMCARVGDFGLARFHPKISNEISEMSSIGLRGSIGYAAPEYGIGSQVSTSGDIYSYGIILLEMMTGMRPTDDIFKDGLNLHNYVKTALPENVHRIIDTVLIYEEQQVETIEEEELGENKDEIVAIEHHGAKLKSSIMAILTIALACSEESPTQRMDINDVIKELHHAKGAVLAG